MENIGNYLQERRKAKGMSLDEVSSKTKIHTNILKNIENNDFSTLGGGGYTKILITTYARVLGMSTTEIENILNKAPKIDPRATKQPKEILNPPTILIHKNFLLFILLLILIAVLTYAVAKLYRHEKISFPFRSRSLLEETQPLPENELPEEVPAGVNEQSSSNSESEINNSEDIVIVLDSENPDNQLTEIVSDLPSDLETEQAEPRFNFALDRTDYLTQYRLLKEKFINNQGENYFAKYVSSF